MKVEDDQDESSLYAATLAAQDVAQRCNELGITALHLKVWATGGSRTKTPALGAQSSSEPSPAQEWRSGGWRCEAHPLRKHAQERGSTVVTSMNGIPQIIVFCEKIAFV